MTSLNIPFPAAETTESDPVTLLESAGSVFATLGERTTVFTMGRAAAMLMSDGSLSSKPFKGTDQHLDVMLRACAEHPDDRFQSVAELYDAWMDAERHLMPKE